MPTSVAVGDYTWTYPGAATWPGFFPGPSGSGNRPAAALPGPVVAVSAGAPPAIPRQSVLIGGTGITFTPASPTGDRAAPGVGVLLVIRNPSATSCSIRIPVPRAVEGLAVADRVIPVPAHSVTATLLLPALYADREQYGLATWTYPVFDPALSVAAVI